jgi:hypothetical protein
VTSRTSAIRRLEYSSWAQLKHDLLFELFGEGRFRPNRYLFRGMRNASWTLTSSFDRRFGDRTPADRLAAWERLTSAWRHSCESAGVARDVVEDDRKLWALGQHYQLPTRLLDWTSSPYVACFFAFNDFLAHPESRDDYVVVWVLDMEDSCWSRELGVEIVAAPSLSNIRLRNQSGMFTLARTPFATLEEYVDHCGAGGALTRAVVPGTEAVDALADLDAMGVNVHQLFPGLEGLAQLVTTRLILELG